MDLEAPDVALHYKGLWMVEAYIRSCKSLLHTRPIYHKCDETIRGHVFCSFLAMVLRQELKARLARRGDEFEWADVIADLDRLQMVEVDRTASVSCCAAKSREPAGGSSKQWEWPCHPPSNRSRRHPRRRPSLVPRRLNDGHSLPLLEMLRK